MALALHQRVLETIARFAMVRPGDRIGLGVSGGADSVAMLRTFAELRAQLGIAIVVLHFNHQLRGADADADERFVEALATDLDFECESGRGDVAGEAQRHGWNLEDAARRKRYEFFDHAAAAYNLNRVAVAHTADDQAETVLSHLLRGTGLAGLAGIYPVAGLIIRPLLEVGRAELREFLTCLGQPWREDATNQDTSRTRARIRHQLIPTLRRDFDPAAVARLARLASHARENEHFWRALENERFQALTTCESRGAISLNVADLLSPLAQLAYRDPAATDEHASASAPTMALTRRLVRRILADLQGSRKQLTAHHVRSVLDLATKSQSGSRIELPGIRVERIFDRLVFTSAAETFVKKTQLDHCFSYIVSPPSPSQPASVVVTEIQRRFNLKLVDWPSAKRDTVIGRGALDFDRVRWPLVLRNWRPGDSYRPHGSQRARKLKRLLLESRVPRCERESWPVLASGAEVIWASGYPVAEQLAPRPETRIGLLIVEEAL